MTDSWESADKSIRKDILKKAELSKKPTERAICSIVIKNVNVAGASIADLTKVFRTEILNELGEKTIVIGEGNAEIDRKIEQAVEMMVINEESLVTIHLALNGSNNKTEENNHVVVNFNITLVKFRPYKPIWEWTPEEKYKIALEHKEVGIQLFKESRYVDAFHRFSKACKILITLEPIPDLELGELENKIHELRHTLYNNMAGCQLHRNNYDHVITLCTKILEKDQNNVKALYRRGVAYGGLNNIEKATTDLKAAVTLAPNDNAIKKQYLIYNQKWKEANQKSNDMVRRMFPM